MFSISVLAYTSPHMLCELIPDISRCDRSTPCRQCIKANIDNCVYVRDSRITLTEAPFEAQETQFFVFDQRQSVKTQHISTKSITAGFEAPDFNDVNFFQTPPQNDQDYEQAQIGFDFSEMDTMELDTGFPVTTFTGLGFPATPITPSFSDLSTVGHGKVTTLFKEKFYGQSHWKNYAHPVCFTFVKNNNRLLTKCRLRKFWPP